MQYSCVCKYVCVQMLRMSIIFNLLMYVIPVLFKNEQLSTKWQLSPLFWPHYLVISYTLDIHYLRYIVLTCTFDEILVCTDAVVMTTVTYCALAYVLYMLGECERGVYVCMQSLNIVCLRTYYNMCLANVSNECMYVCAHVFFDLTEHVQESMSMSMHERA